MKDGWISVKTPPEEEGCYLVTYRRCQLFYAEPERELNESVVRTAYFGKWLHKDNDGEYRHSVSWVVDHFGEKVFDAGCPVQECGSTYMYFRHEILGWMPLPESCEPETDRWEERRPFFEEKIREFKMRKEEKNEV